MYWTQKCDRDKLMRTFNAGGANESEKRAAVLRSCPHHLHNP